MNMKAFFSPENQNFVGFTHFSRFFLLLKECAASQIKKKKSYCTSKKKSQKMNISLKISQMKMEPPMHAVCLLMLAEG